MSDMPRCGAVRQSRDGTRVYTSPCQLPADHDDYHLSYLLRDGSGQRWLYASDPRQKRGRVTVASIHFPHVDMSDERLAVVLDQWAADQGGRP